MSENEKFEVSSEWSAKAQINNDKYNEWYKNWYNGFTLSMGEQGAEQWL